MLRALGHIRRMRGGARSHLMRCSDGHYYVVKFQNNPQHPRILVNEMLATRIASRIGLPTAPVGIVGVSQELIELTPELCVENAAVASPMPARFGIRFSLPAGSAPRHNAGLPSRRFAPPSGKPGRLCRNAGAGQVALQHERTPGDFFSPRARKPRSGGI